MYLNFREFKKIEIFLKIMICLVNANLKKYLVKTSSLNNIQFRNNNKKFKSVLSKIDVL